MINDTQEGRDETIAWLKKHGLYHETLSNVQLAMAHTIYWTMKEEQKDGI